MKGRIFHKITTVLLLMVFLTSIGTMLTSVGHVKYGLPSDSSEDTTNIQVVGNNLTEKQYQDEKISLDLTEFSENISVAVNREVLINQWMFVKVNTTVNITNNEETVEFNSLNLTIPDYEYSEIQYFDIEGDELTYEIIEDPNSKFVTVVIQTPLIGFEESYSFKIVYGEGDAVKVNAPSLTEDKGAYSYNSTFLPFLSIPITQYNATTNVFAHNNYAELTIYEDSILPQTEDIGINVTKQGNLFKVENLQELPQVDLLELDEYNFDNWDNSEAVKFIPAFKPSLEENMTITNYVEFTINTPFIKYERVDSTFVISQWEDIQVTETITLNVSGPIGNTIGGTAWGSDADLARRKYMLRLYGPGNMKLESSKDPFGNVTATASKTSFEFGFGSNVTRIDITPRVNLGSNEFIGEIQEYTFTLTYKLKASDYLTDLGNGKFEFKAPLGLKFNWTVHEMSVNYIFPSGANNIKSAEFEQYRNTKRFSNLLIFSKPGFELNLEDATMLHNVGFSITYRMPIFWPIIDPLIYSTLFLLVGLIYITTKTASQFFVASAVYTEEEIPYTSIEEFVKAYQEKTAIRERILGLKRERTRKGVKKVDRSIKILQQKLKEVDRELISAINKLSKKGRRFREAIQRIEIAEAERSDVLDLINNLKQKKKERRIRNVTYRKLLQDYQSRLKRANNTIDKTLIELRGLLTERQ